MTETINLKGGVLIIGSLLWQDHLENSNQDNIRNLWRNRHLLMSHKIMVKAPIRYGRISKSDIYTMTFSNALSEAKKGTAYFIPFLKTPIFTINDLFNEANETSIAEGMHGHFLSKESGTENAWCILGILFNPKTIKKETQITIETKWKEKIRQRGNFDIDQFKLGDEDSCIDQNGKLNIDWPVPIDKRDSEILNSYDFIIATATKPTHYPDTEELLVKVKADNTRFYFIGNYKSGITTHQDIEIINGLTK